MTGTLPDIATFDDLRGHTLASVVNEHNERIVFTLTDGRTYGLWHDQDCCESVSVEDICGDLEALVGSPILLAEEVTTADDGENRGDESYTWTFYKLATVRGAVTIRWYGTSNGYYSERVTFGRLGE